MMMPCFFKILILSLFFLENFFELISFCMDLKSNFLIFITAPVIPEAIK